MAASFPMISWNWEGWTSASVDLLICTKLGVYAAQACTKLGVYASNSSEKKGWGMPETRTLLSFRAKMMEFNGTLASKAIDP